VKRKKGGEENHTRENNTGAKEASKEKCGALGDGFVDTALKHKNVQSAAANFICSVALHCHLTSSEG